MYMDRRAKIIVKGNVQGVFYRDHTKEKAKELELKGYVKNEPNGTVKIVVEGKKEHIDKLVEWCHEGSPLAKVEDVSVELSPPMYEFEVFKSVR